MERIRFKINYEVKQKRKFEEFLNHYQKKARLDFKELIIDRYSKIENQFQAKFYVETNIQEKEKRVYEILNLANLLFSSGCSNWKFHGPFETGSLTFECILNNDDEDQPLKWAHMALENG